MGGDLRHRVVDTVQQRLGGVIHGLTRALHGRRSAVNVENSATKIDRGRCVARRMRPPKINKATALDDGTSRDVSSCHTEIFFFFLIFATASKHGPGNGSSLGYLLIRAHVSHSVSFQVSAAQVPFELP
jgi:hypothetical protein